MTYPEVAAALGSYGAVQPTVRDGTWVLRQGQLQIILGFKNVVFDGTVFANQVDDSGLETRSVQSGPG